MGIKGEIWMIKKGKFHDRSLIFFICRFFVFIDWSLGFFFSSSDLADSSVGELLLLSILNGLSCFFLSSISLDVSFFRC